MVDSMLEIYSLENIGDKDTFQCRLIWVAESAEEAILESIEKYKDNECWPGYEKQITANKIGVPFATTLAGEL